MTVIHTQLLPDVDGTVIAAGPLVGGDGMMYHRIVLRRQKDGSYVVHAQQYPKLGEGDTRTFPEYHNGDYYGHNLEAAYAGFVKRLIRMGNTAFGVSTEDMLPESFTK